MPRGGRRNGKPGTAYPNRGDLQTAQPVRTVPGQPYGQAGAQAQAQHAIPLPAQPQPVAASPAQVAPPTPPEPGMLHSPSVRPGEPVTAGLSVGAGPGPEALAGQGMTGQALNDLRMVYRLFPSEEVRQIIERLEGQNAVR